MMVPRAAAAGLALTALFAASWDVSAQTIVRDHITSSTTWRAADGPYIVAAEVELLNRATLTIEPGVEVRFEPNMSLAINEGRLIARGTAAEPIRFTRNGADPWNGLHFGGGAIDATFDAGGAYTGGCILQYATVDGAQVAGITTYDASPYLSHVTVHDTLGRGLSLTYADGIHVEDCTIRDNKSLSFWDPCGGVYVRVAVGALFRGNTITGNYSYEDGGGMYLRACNGALFADNIITGNYAESAGDGIYAYSNTDLVLSGNTISGNIGSGLYAEKFDNLQLVGNTFADNSGYAIHVVYDSAGVRLSGGNRLLNNGSNGFSIGSGVTGIVLSADPDDPTWIYGNSPADGIQLHNGYAAPANAEYVWWNTTDPSVIRAAITFPETVDYVPFYVPDPHEPGDVNGDGQVNIFDAFGLNAAWGRAAGGRGYDWFADFNGDGQVNIFDAFVLNQNWGSATGTAAGLDPAGAVPEPATGGMLLVAGAILCGPAARRPRRRGAVR
jgi:parallel beta-helix repeat protein